MTNTERSIVIDYMALLILVNILIFLFKKICLKLSLALLPRLDALEVNLQLPPYYPNPMVPSCPRPWSRRLGSTSRAVHLAGLWGHWSAVSAEVGTKSPVSTAACHTHFLLPQPRGPGGSWALRKRRTSSLQSVPSAPWFLSVGFPSSFKLSLLCSVQREDQG